MTMRNHDERRTSDPASRRLGRACRPAAFVAMALCLVLPQVAGAAVKPKPGAWLARLGKGAEVHLFVGYGGTFVGVDQGRACTLDPLGASATVRIPYGNSLKQGKAAYDRRFRGAAISFAGMFVSDSPNLRGALMVPDATFSGRFTSPTRFTGSLRVPCVWQKGAAVARSFTAKYVRPVPPRAWRPAISPWPAYLGSP